MKTWIFHHELDQHLKLIWSSLQELNFSVGLSETCNFVKVQAYIQALQSPIQFPRFI